MEAGWWCKDKRSNKMKCVCGFEEIADEKFIELSIKSAQQQVLDFGHPPMAFYTYVEFYACPKCLTVKIGGR